MNDVLESYIAMLEALPGISVAVRAAVVAGGRREGA